MSEGAAFFVRRYGLRLTVTGLVGIWLSGCSTDSSRFSEGVANPFSNPFSTASNESAPVRRVTSAPLAQASNPNYAVVAHPSPVAVASLPNPAPAATGRIPTPSVQPTPIGGSSAGWSAVGGSPIVVAEGDNAERISSRYGVPVAALVSANGLSSSSQIRGGSRVVIPVYNAGGHAARTAAAEPEHVLKTPKAEKNDREEKADAGDLAKKKKEKAAEAKVEKSAKVDAPKGEKADKVAKAEKPAKSEPAVTTVAKAEPVKPAARKAEIDTTPTGRADPAAAPQTAAQADASGSSPEFRWPARGRIIQGFKSGGNEGINIAVPEGTSVRAAENGVVAYAGDGLKGYGNLVLIRHPNGFVSAYANNGELNVKAGEQVKRGQVIAKSGASGNVNSPQLHFELRKGSTPVDPTNYLAGL